LDPKRGINGLARTRTPASARQLEAKRERRLSKPRADRNHIDSKAFERFISLKTYSQDLSEFCPSSTPVVLPRHRARFNRHRGRGKTALSRCEPTRRHDEMTDGGENLTDDCSGRDVNVLFR
jgi:hypothetical protein